MSNSTPRPSGRSRGSRLPGVGGAFALAGLILAADQASKWLVRRAAADLPFELGWGFGLRLVSNQGISFGRLEDAGGLVLVAVAALTVALVVAVAVAPPPYNVGLAVMLGGAAGNLADRVRHGAVVDFVDVPWWPTFNLADVAIVAGVVMVAWAALRGARA